MARSAAAKADADERDVVPAVDDSAASGATGGSTAQRERRRRILDATLALGLQGGYDAVQMRTVAEKADVAVGTCTATSRRRSTCLSPRCRASSSASRPASTAANLPGRPASSVCAPSWT